MGWVEQKVKQAHSNGYSLGYAAGMRRSDKFAVACLSPPLAQPAPTRRPWTGSMPLGVYADMAKSMDSMQLFFRAMVDEYPHARGSGRLDKWQAAMTAYVDLISCEEKPAKRANLVLVAKQDTMTGGSGEG